jgi:transposase-like protein
MRSPQKFDETFKREAVANWLSSGKSARVIAEELGIKPDRLYTWKKPFGRWTPGGGRPPGQRPAAGTWPPSWKPPGGRSVTCVNSGTF